MKQIRSLVRSVELYGLDSINQVSRHAQIPAETARYMIWHELPAHLIHVGVDLNIQKIGLKRWKLQVELPRQRESQELNNILGKDAGIVYSARILPATNLFFAFLLIPSNEEYKLRIQLDRLQKIQKIKSYSLEQVQLMRNVSFDPSYYNFKKRSWDFTWKAVGANIQRLREEGIAHFQVKKDRKRTGNNTPYDYADIIILKEFLRKIPRSISKISKDTEFGAHNLRYHYKKHARSMIEGYYLRVMPSNPNEQTGIVFSVRTPDEDVLRHAQSVALSLPFTISEWTTQNTYEWFVSCPGEYLAGVLRFVVKNLETKIGELGCLLLDPSTEFVDTLPYRLFDTKNGRWKYEPKISLQSLQVDFDLLKSVCKYANGDKCTIYKPQIQNCEISLCPFVKA